MNIQELLLEKRSIDINTGCWLWTGRLNNKGYGVIANTEGRRRCLTCQKEYNKNNWKRYADRRIR